MCDNAPDELTVGAARRYAIDPTVIDVRADPDNPNAVIVERQVLLAAQRAALEIERRQDTESWRPFVADPAPQPAPPLPLTTYVRSRLLTMLRGPDVPQAVVTPPDFRGCPLRGQIACLTNLLLIERGLVDASRAADRPWWNELDAAHKKESEWLGAFQIHERVRGA